MTLKARLITSVALSLAICTPAKALSVYVEFTGNIDAATTITPGVTDSTPPSYSSISIYSNSISYSGDIPISSKIGVSRWDDPTSWQNSSIVYVFDGVTKYFELLDIKGALDSPIESALGIAEGYPVIDFSTLLSTTELGPTEETYYAGLTLSAKYLPLQVDIQVPVSFEFEVSIVNGSSVLVNQPYVKLSTLNVDAGGFLDGSHTSLYVINDFENDGTFTSNGFVGQFDSNVINNGQLTLSGNVTIDGDLTNNGTATQRGSLIVRGIDNTSYLTVSNIVFSQLGNGPSATIEIVAGGNMSLLDGGDIGNDGRIQLDSGANFSLSGTITNEGLIALNGSPGSGASLAIAGTATLAGGGVVQLSDDPDNQILGTTRFGGLTTLVNMNNTIEGGGTIGNIPSYNQYTSLALVNHGTVDANVSTPLTLDLGSGSTNDGTMQASNGGTLIFASGPLDNTGGTIQALDGSTVAFQGATLSNLQGPTLVSGSYKVQGLQSAATLDLGRGIATNQASIVVSGGLATFTSLTPLANNTGSLQFDSGAQFTTQGDFVNTGTLRILGAQSAFDVNGNFSQTVGLTLLNGGEISASGMLNVSGGSFGGQGTIQGAVNISDGVLQVGASPDSLTIAGAFDQTGGTVRFEVYEEPNGSFETDTLILQDPFSSNISGAKVIFDFVGAANPEDFFKTGDFSLLSFVDLSGGTDASGLSRIFAGDQYEIMSDDFQVRNFVFSAADGAEQLQIAPAGSVPEPGTWMILIEGAALLGGALRAVRRRRQSCSTLEVAQ